MSKPAQETSRRAVGQQLDSRTGHAVAQHGLHLLVLLASRPAACPPAPCVSDLAGQLQPWVVHVAQRLAFNSRMPCTMYPSNGFISSSTSSRVRSGPRWKPRQRRGRCPAGRGNLRLLDHPARIFGQRAGLALERVDGKRSSGSRSALSPGFMPTPCLMKMPCSRQKRVVLRLLTQRLDDPAGASTFCICRSTRLDLHRLAEMLRGKSSESTTPRRSAGVRAAGLVVLPG